MLLWKGGGQSAVFKQAVAGCTLSTSKQLAIPPPTRCFSTFAQSRKARITYLMAVMNTVLTQSRFSGLACGRCEMKYTTISDINFVTEIGCTEPGKNIVRESNCTMPEVNTGMVISCANTFLQFPHSAKITAENGLRQLPSTHNLSNSLITNHHLTKGRGMITMRHFRLLPRCKRELRYFGILRSVELQFRSDVSGQPVGPIFKGQAVQDDYHYNDNVV